MSLSVAARDPKPGQDQFFRKRASFLPTYFPVLSDYRIVVGPNLFRRDVHAGAPR